MSDAAVTNVALMFFLSQWRHMAMWPALVYDYSSEVAEYGPGIDMPIDDLGAQDWSQTSISDARGADLADHRLPAPTVPQATKEVLLVDQLFAKRRLIPFANRLQLRPSQIMSQTEELARQAAIQVNNYIRAQIQAVAVAGSQIPAIAGTAANFASGGVTSVAGTSFGKAIYDRLSDADEAFNAMAAPMERRLCVMSIHDQRLLRDYILSLRINFETPVNDDLLRLGLTGRLFNFDIMVDKTSGNGLTNADDANHTIFFFIRNEEGFGWAQQARQIIPVDSFSQGGEYNGMELRGRQLFGAKLSQPSKIRRCLVNLA